MKAATSALPAAWLLTLGVSLGACAVLQPPARVTRDALRERARVDLECSESTVVKKSATGEAVVTEGCGRRVVYAMVHCMGPLAMMSPEYPCSPGGLGEGGIFGRGLSYAELWVPVSQPVKIVELYRSGDDTFSGKSVVEAAARLVRLNEQGAHDLHCPRDQVLPSLAYAGSRASSIPVAEGCGQRATYLPGESLRLSALVKMPD